MQTRWFVMWKRSHSKCFMYVERNMYFNKLKHGLSNSYITKFWQRVCITDLCLWCFFRNFSLFSPRALTTQVFTIFTMYDFFLKFPGMVNGQIWSLLWHGRKEEDLKKMQALSSSKKFRKLIFKGTIWRVLRGQCLHLFQNESGFSMMGLF